MKTTTMDLPFGHKMPFVILGIFLCLIIPVDQSDISPKLRRTAKGYHQHSEVVPYFEDRNSSLVVGEPGGGVFLDCNVFMLHDYTVSWSHRPQTGPGDSLDLLTVGNSTYTLEPRVSSRFKHPANWGLQISNLKPEDAGTYLCQISTFPPMVRLVYLEIRGPMIEISHEDQMVYNAGSHLEIRCVYRNTTGIKNNNQRNNHHHRNRHQNFFTTPDSSNSGINADVRRILELSRRRQENPLGDIFNLDPIGPGLITWLHNGSTFSHMNRRRVRHLRKSDHILSTLSIKSAIISDSGNYSCVLSASNHSDTIKLVVVAGEHSAAIYENGGDIPAAAGIANSAVKNKIMDISLWISTVITKSWIFRFGSPSSWV